MLIYHPYILLRPFEYIFFLYDTIRKKKLSTSNKKRIERKEKRVGVKKKSKKKERDRDDPNSNKS